MRYRYGTCDTSAKEGDNEEMNENIMRELGFSKEVEAAKAGKCPLCGHEIMDYWEFRDNLSIKEFHISGMRQKCQDGVFGK